MDIYTHTYTYTDTHSYIPQNIFVLYVHFILPTCLPPWLLFIPFWIPSKIVFFFAWRSVSDKPLNFENVFFFFFKAYLFFYFLIFW